MRLYHTIVFLMTLCTVSPVERNPLRLGVQRKVSELFSFQKLPGAPVLADLNCELNLSFVNHLVASHLSLRLTRRPKVVSIDTIAAYAKVFSVGNNNERFYLGLYCHLDYQGFRGPMDHYLPPPFLGRVDELFIQVKAPAHSFALLWVTVPKNFWEMPANRMAADFAQIYAFWDNNTGELILSAASGLNRKWYTSFAAVFVRDYQPLQRFYLRDLHFGETAVQHLEMMNIQMRPFRILSEYSLTRIELRHPKGPNASIVVEFTHRLAGRSSNALELSRFSSYHSVVAIARVPPFSSSEQMVASLIRAEIWLLIVSCALAAAAVLHYVKEDFCTTLFSLLLSILFPVTLNFQTKTRQFLMIVGTWILLLQVIRYGFQGDFVASRQRLPENRAKSIRRCEPLDPSTVPQDGIGYTLDDNLDFYFFHDLPVILKGAVICRAVGGFGPSRETLLRDVPTYTLKSIQETSPHLIVSDFGTKVHEGAAVINSRAPKGGLHETTSLGGKFCCFRLAQLSLAHALFHRELLSSVWRNDRKFFDIAFEEIMNLSLSDEHHLKNCSFFDRAHLKYVRCFTLEDLHPRNDHGMRSEDVDSTMKIHGVLCSASIVCFLLEILLAYLLCNRIHS